MICPNCNHSNPDDARLCGGCGLLLETWCLHCGMQVNPNARYCPGCGSPVTRTTPATPATPAAPAAAGLPRDPAGVIVLGTILQSRYQILRHLGRGGFGAIYEARDRQRSNRTCAIKELLDPTPDSRRQFLREAAFLQQLQHPNLVPVTDHFETGAGELFLVMDFIPGQDLDQVLAKARGLLAEDRVIEWAIQVCKVLKYIHTWVDPATGDQHAIIHRDIKPANLKLHPDGTLFVIDFGIAKTMQPGRKTTVGAQAYSVPYSPIEQYRTDQGANTDERSDIYALGATLYHLATGHEPPDGATVAQRAHPPDPADHRPGIDPRLRKAIRRAMQRRKEDRFPSAQSMLDALTAVPQPAATVQPPASSSPTAPSSGGSGARPQPSPKKPAAPRVRGVSPVFYIQPAPPGPAHPAKRMIAAVVTALGSPSTRRSFLRLAGICAVLALLLGAWWAFSRGPWSSSPPAGVSTLVSSVESVVDKIRAGIDLPSGASIFGTPLPGSPGADRIISYEPGPGARAEYTDPEAALGAPDLVESPCCQGMVQLGRGGTLLLAFTDNTIVDGDGPDFQIFGESANDDYLRVEISENGKDWHAFPRVGENGGGRDIYGRGLSQVVYVRLTDLQPATSTGAEIDAVVALNNGSPPAGGLPRVVEPDAPPPAPKPSATRRPKATATRKPAARPTKTPAEQWVLVADSAADYPGLTGQRKWWYLWSSGRNNFHWQEMEWDAPNYHYHSPNDWEIRIWQDRITTDPRGDVAVQWKAPRGGTYRFEWNAASLAFYQHLNYHGSSGPGPTLPHSAIVRDVIDWELFFWVATSPTPYHIRVYRLEE